MRSAASRRVVRMSQPFRVETATRALEATHVAFFSRMGLCPGGQTGSYRGVTWNDSGADYPLFNSAFSTGPDPRSETIAEVVHHFREANRSFTWWSLPSQSTERLSDLLVAAGLVHEEDAPGMALDLTNRGSPPPSPQGLSIETLDEADNLVRFGQTLNAGDFQAPAPIAREIPRLLRPRPGEAGVRFFVGFLGDRPVATALRFLRDRVVGIYGIATIPEARRQGIGAAMTLAAINDGRDAGGNLAVLTSTSLGFSVYQRLGFRQCCRLGANVWHPPSASRRI